jgi:TusE/DsrC/DsvC family sulfur relay protein
MKEIEVAGNRIELTDEGFLTDSGQWTEEVAKALAQEENIDLTEKHFAVLNYLRQENAAGTGLTIRKVGKSGLVDIKGLYELFPGGPLKKSSKIAGIPKPTSCV